MVNVASKCGYTPQYEGLEQLQREMKGKGFNVLGFPSNDFGGQEPGTAQEIATFCRLTYDVTFPMFEKVVTMRGARQSPIYAFLGRFGKLPAWNFTSTSWTSRARWWRSSKARSRLKIRRCEPRSPGPCRPIDAPSGAHSLDARRNVDLTSAHTAVSFPVKASSLSRATASGLAALLLVAVGVPGEFVRYGNTVRTTRARPHSQDSIDSTHHPVDEQAPVISARGDEPSTSISSPTGTSSRKIDAAIRLARPAVEPGSGWTLLDSASLEAPVLRPPGQPGRSRAPPVT